VVDGDKLIASLPPMQDLSPPKPWNLAGILYTGGTTGPSKGVMIPWGYYMNSIQNLNYVGTEDAFYAPFPMFHGTGKVPFLAMGAFGGRVVVKEQFKTHDFWHDVDHYKCTITILLPAMAKWVLALPPSPNDQRHSLKFVTMISDMDAFRKRFNVIVNTHFGMTEAGVPIGRNNVTDRFNSCGTVKPGYEVRLVDDLDYEVPAGEVGELTVRTSQPWTLSQGYFGKPEKSWEAWRNGWLHTGDAMRRDADGYYYFVDRKRDYMRRRGENISSFEVEAIVSQHPDLTGVAAIGVPSEHGEDEVKIVATRREGSALTHAELIHFLIPRMPRFMVPRYIEFVESLPRTPSTQNVRKVELRTNPLNENTWDREAAGIEIPK
jgi:crotonobetaine/carnitine-CoA ligase